MSELEARKIKSPTTGTEALLMGILIEGESPPLFDMLCFYYLHRLVSTRLQLVMFAFIIWTCQLKNTPFKCLVREG